MRLPGLRLLTGALLALGLAAGPLAAGPLAVGPGAPAGATVAAQDPVDFGTGHVVDDAHVLSQEDVTTITAAAQQLYAQHHVDLFVVYVDTFTAPTEAADWANETAARNGLGQRDYLLAVSTAGRTYYLSGDDAGPVSPEQLDGIEQNNVEPKLHAGDWAGAGVAAAAGLGDALGGSGGGATFFWVFLIGVIVVGLLVFLLVRTRRSRRKQAAAGPATPQSELHTIPLADLERRAGSALVQTDDAIRTSEQELAYATAQYGGTAVVPFQAALDAAKGQLREAFALKQRLDDAEPDTDEQRREWNIHIVQLCGAANQALDAQADAFDELRALEKRIPEATAELTSRVSALRQRLTTSRSTLDGLARRYADAALATVHDNIDQASQRLDFAETALAGATQQSEGNAGAAAVGVRAAEESADQAGLLLDAVDRLGTDLDAAQQSLDRTIAELRSDLAEARALAASSDPGGTIAATAAGTEQTVTDVQAALAAGRVDPLELARRLDAANRSIDAVLQGVRDARAQAQRAQSALQQTLLTARARVSACEDFLTARRGAVGPAARTRLAEASRLVAQAEQTATTDAGSALAQAQRAAQLADEATQLAQQDVGGFQPGMGGGLGGVFGGGTVGAGGGGGAVGAILGGILIDSVLGGGLGGGWGGGGNWGGGGGGWGGGGFSAGSFGGGGTRSRRGGGRF